MAFVHLNKRYVMLCYVMLLHVLATIPVSHCVYIGGFTLEQGGGLYSTLGFRLSIPNGAWEQKVFLSPFSRPTLFSLADGVCGRWEASRVMSEEDRKGVDCFDSNGDFLHQLTLNGAIVLEKYDQIQGKYSFCTDLRVWEHRTLQ